MSTHNIQFHDKRKFLCFLELSEEFRTDSKMSLKSAMLNEPSVFELLRFDCMLSCRNKKNSLYIPPLICSYDRSLMQ